MSDYQLQIERLVDGELSFAEEAKLLQACEHHPAGWKQLALAFLEDRTYHTTFTADVSRSASATAIPETAIHSTPGTSSRPSRKSKALQITAACAVLVAAFLSGRHSSTTGANGDPDGTIADSNPASERERRVGHEFPQELPPPIEFVSLNVGAERENAQTVDVPLLPWDQVATAAELEDIGPPPSLIPDKIRELLARRGRTVRESIDYYRFELSDGRVGVIPVSSIEIQANTIPLIQ